MECSACHYQFKSIDPRIIVSDTLCRTVTFCENCFRHRDPLKPGFRLMEEILGRSDLTILEAKGRCASCGTLIMKNDWSYLQAPVDGKPALLRCKPCQERIEGRDEADVIDIEGLKIIPLKREPDERGTRMHMMKARDAWFESFGEVYFETVFPGIVKGWHKQHKMTMHYACIFGRVKLVIFDDREGSKTKNNLEEIFLGPDDHSLVIIPSGLWSGFKGLSDPYTIMANCASHPYDKDEVEYLPPKADVIPYDWYEINQ